MEFTPVQTLYEFIDNALKLLLTTGIRNVMLALGALIGTIWLINFTMRSMRWLIMGLNQSAQDIVYEIFKMAFIAGMAFNVGWYITTIVPFVTDAPAWMAGLLSGQSGSQVNQIDSMIATYSSTLIAMIKNQAFSLLKMDMSVLYTGGISIVLFILGGIPFLLAVVSTLLVIKAVSTMLLALGPLFIALALFDRTRHWFWNWVSQMAGFMLTQVLFSVVLAMEVAFINTAVLKDGKMDPSISGAISMFIFFAVFLVLVTELPNYAASIMGASPAGAGVSGVVSKYSGIRTAARVANFARSKLPGNKIAG
ncbi:TrbL/VirB6 family protein (plasmid) [Pseudomonas amygdali pv. morsprunorum]